MRTIPEVDYSRKWFVMAAVGMATFLETIDSSIVALSLPTLARALDADFALVQWVILAFVLTQTALMLVVGRLGDVVGKKPIFVTGVALAGLGTLLCGLAPNIGWLLGFRVVQAAGTAMALALNFGIATEAFPPQERGKALGAIGGIVSVGIVMGPLLGGLILEALSWRWIFFINVPIALVGIPVALRYLPDVRSGQREPFDFAGATTFFFGLLAFLLATTFGQRSGYGAPHILGLFAASAGLFLLFLWIERRSSHPVVDLSLFRMPAFNANLLLRFLSFVVFVSVSLLLPFYLESVMGVPPRRMGLLLTVVPIAFGVTAPFAGTLADRFGNRPLVLIGLILFFLGFIALSTLDQSVTTAGYILRVLMVGAGMGILQSPNNSIIMGSVPPKRLGMTSGLLSVVRTLGRSTGIGLLGAFWAARTLIYADGTVSDATNAPAAAQVAGLHETYLVAAGIVLSAIVLLAWEWRQTQKSR